MGGEEEPRSEELESQLAEFKLRYPCDERASDFLEGLSPDQLLKVLTTFDPRNKDETDYSRQVTGYIRSIRNDASLGSRKRPTEDDEEEVHGGRRGKRQRVSESGPDLEAFRARYPMDDRAFEFLEASPAGVQERVVQEFKPRSDGDADYSSLVTTMVKKTREQDRAGDIQRAGPSGPPLAKLEDFKSRYPMDERAWDFLVGTSGSAQERVIGDFRPRSEGDSDYSAAVTAFLRSMSARPTGAPSRATLDTFRIRFPMDDRAFDFLLTSPPEVQQDAVATFSPRNLEDTDFSRPLTSFLKKLREGAPSSGHGGGGRSGLSGKLRAFRSRYPMDDRAFGFLEESPPDVVEDVLADFRPRREGDSDYSAAVTTFVRNVRQRAEARSGGGGQGRDVRDHRDSRDHRDGRDRRDHRDSRDSYARGGRSGDMGGRRQLESFRRRYPMDERALDLLEQAAPDVQRCVFSDFKPRREGESDYSGAVTSFVRAVQRRIGDGGRSDVRDARSDGGSRHDGDRGGGGMRSQLESFKRRYPMDDRAWDYVCGASEDAQRSLVERFRPQREGERDYSALVTSYMKRERGGGRH